MDGVTDNVIVMMPGIQRFLSGNREERRSRETSDLSLVNYVSCSENTAVLVAQGAGKSAQVIYAIDNPLEHHALDQTDFLPNARYILNTISYVGELGNRSTFNAAQEPVGVNVLASADVIQDWAARGLFSGRFGPAAARSMLKVAFAREDEGAVFRGRGVISDEEPRLRLKP